MLPESYSLLWGIEGFQESVATYITWLNEKKIPEDFALQVAYSLRDWWGTAKAKKTKRDNPWYTFTNWVVRDWGKAKQAGSTDSYAARQRRMDSRLPPVNEVESL